MTDNTNNKEYSDCIRILENTVSQLKQVIQESKRTEYENNKNIAFLNGLLDQSIAGIYIINNAGFFSYVNQTFAHIFGYSSPKEIIGQFKIETLVAPEAQKLVLENINKRATGRIKEIRYIFTGLRKNGSRNTVEVHGHSIRDQGETSIMGLMIDVTDYQRVSELAFYDSLTNLPNRALFTDRLKQMIAHAERDHKGFTLLFIDLDGFKKINDEYGHAAGDFTLKCTAERLLKECRTLDTVCRLGGDEFVILFAKQCNRNDVEEIALRLLHSLKKPFIFNEQTFDLSASIGISIYPQDGTDHVTLLHNADSAMYRAKNHGKNTYFFHGNH